MMKQEDIAAIIGLALERAEFGASHDDPDTEADVAAILDLLGEQPDQPDAVAYWSEEDEAKHPRDHGKFSSKEGQSGEGGKPAETPPEEDKAGAIRKALRMASGWLTPRGIAQKAKALAYGVAHPKETAKAARDVAKEKVKKLVERYGKGGAACIVGAYVAYYSLAATLAPNLLLMPIPLTPTVLTTAETVRKLSGRGKEDKKPAKYERRVVREFERDARGLIRRVAEWQE